MRIGITSGWFFKTCALARVRRLPQLSDNCPPEQYLPRNEKELEVTH